MEKSTTLALLVLLSGSASFAASLDAKLEHQFDRYDRAGEALVAHALRSRAPLGHEAWERMLMPAPEYRLSEADLEALRARQRAEIEAARKGAAARSRFDLEPQRADARALDAFCRRIPKGGLLHVHPGGTYEKSTVERFLRTLNPTVNWLELAESIERDDRTLLYPDEIAFLRSLPEQPFNSYDPATRERLQGLFTLSVEPSSHSFERFSATFRFLSLLNDPFLLKEILTDFIARASDLNVSYVEFTSDSDPTSILAIGFRTLWGWSWRRNHGVTVRWNYAFNRLEDPGENERRVLDLLDDLSFYTPGFLVGIDLLSNEKVASALSAGQRVYPRIRRANRRGESDLGVAMHAGELGRRSNVRDAMILGVERIGHGVALAESPVALEYARRRDVAVVVNLVANLRLGVVDSVEQHPFLDFLRLGIPVSLSTDDEGIFQTDVARECREAVTSTDVTYWELTAMARHSIDRAFADEETKRRLRSKLAEDLRHFEEAWQREFGMQRVDRAGSGHRDTEVHQTFRRAESR